MQKSVIKGTLQVPGDKSISHRALIFSLLAQGRCRVSQMSPADDCQSTMSCLKSLGVHIEKSADHVYIIDSPGLSGLKAPGDVLDTHNSGTTIRLMSGLLAGQAFSATFDGDASLRQRPMSRVLNHLVEMGANVTYEGRDNCAPFKIKGGDLQGKHFSLDVASAQVQTALMLAGLQAGGETSVELPALVRDHTERMFTHAGVPFKSNGLTMSVSRLEKPMAPFEIVVAGDISSAAFFMVAAAILPGSEITLTGVGLNPGRTLVIDVLKEMGADLAITDEHIEGGEPVGTITVRGGARLKGVKIEGNRIAAGIDEIPILALAGSLCEGTFSVRNADELRVKESDRLQAIISNLRSAGAKVTAELPDGFDLQGVEQLRGGCMWSSHYDHRLAMMGLVASKICRDNVVVDDPACVAVSYPKFEQDLARLLGT